MKGKLIYALLGSLIIISNFTFTSCKTEGHIFIAEPIITLTSTNIFENPYIGDKGEFIDFTFTATIEKKFERFRIVELIDQTETVLVDITKQTDPSLDGATEFRHLFTYELKESNTAPQVIWLIEDEEQREGRRIWSFFIN